MTKLNLTQVMHGESKPEKLSAEQLTCYSYDPITGAFAGVTHGRESPRRAGVIHWPAHTTTIAPPYEAPEGFVWKWEVTNWVSVEDHRGEIWYAMNDSVYEDGQAIGITTLGAPPKYWTKEPPDIGGLLAAFDPTTDERFFDSSGEVTYDPDKFLNTAAIEQIWEQIKLELKKEEGK